MAWAKYTSWKDRIVSLFAEQLRSNCAASLPDIPSIRDILSQANTEMERLNTEIAPLEEILGQLRTERMDLAVFVQGKSKSGCQHVSITCQLEARELLRLLQLSHVSYQIMSSSHTYHRLPNDAQDSADTLAVPENSGIPTHGEDLDSTSLSPAVGVDLNGKYSKWLLYMSLGLASYIYSLDGSTTYNYLSFATSTYGKHTMISAIQVAQSITIAVGKPVVAKIADVSSRGMAYLVVLIFYVLGYVTIAASQNIGWIACGIILYSVGFTGLQLLTQIIIADITTLKWRGLISGLTSTPFIINAFIGGLIVDWVLRREGESWRLGYLMFAILIPVCLAPLILTLFWTERKVKKRGILKRLSSYSYSTISPSAPRHSRQPTATSTGPAITTSAAQSLRMSPSSPIQQDRPRPRSHSRTHLTSQSHGAFAAHRSSMISQYPDMTLGQKVWRTVEQLDAVGLVLLGVGVGMILVPLTLTRADDQKKAFWQHGWMVGIFLSGACIVLPLFVLWDSKIAKNPVVPLRFFVRNRTVLAASLIAAFDFASFYLTYMYLFSWVVVVKPWPLRNAQYFSQIQTVVMTIFGILAGVSMRVYHRYKYLLITGLFIRLGGVMLMLHTRTITSSATSSTTSSNLALIFTQVLQGIGGGLAAIASQVAAQAAVPHSDLATVTALLLLCAEVGGALGGAIAGAIWAGMMPERLKQYVGWLSKEERDELFGSIVAVASRPMGDPVREGVIRAYADVMSTMVLWATAMSIIPVCLAFLMPDWYLGDRQNAVEGDEGPDPLLVDGDPNAVFMDSEETSESEDTNDGEEDVSHEV